MSLTRTLSDFSTQITMRSTLSIRLQDAVLAVVIEV